MNRRALALSLLIAGVTAALMVLYLQRFEREMSGGDKVPLVIAIKTIERGTTVTDDMLAVRSVPLAYVEDRAVKQAERSKILGLQASHTIYPQQIVQWTDLAITTEERSLSSLVQLGKRAVTVRAFAGGDARGNKLIRPGDYLDVIATMPDESMDGEDSAAVLLQRVLVLAVGSDTEGPAVAPKGAPGADTEKLLTLSLTLSESQLLALALEKGSLSVAVRRPDDPSVQDGIPDMKLPSLLDTKLRAEVQRTPSANEDGPIRIRTSSGR